MNKDCQISLYLDTRRAKKSGKYPVKLRVFTNQPRKQMLYPTTFEFTEKEFQNIWETQKPRSEFKEIRNELTSVKLFADEVAKDIKPFSFQQFEKKLYRSKGDGNNIVYHYNQIISNLSKNNYHSTANNYQLSLRSFKEFLKNKTGKEVNIISFHSINPEWLNNYESFMLNELKRSRTTVSMYVRTLRTVFNKAITDQEIESRIYPFGKGKYQPPTVRNVKKALSKEHLKLLYEANPKTSDQEKSKGFLVL